MVDPKSFGINGKRAIRDPRRFGEPPLGEANTSAGAFEERPATKHNVSKPKYTIRIVTFRNIAALLWPLVIRRASHELRQLSMILASRRWMGPQALDLNGYRWSPCI
jgi:hypothetical protein